MGDADDPDRSSVEVKALLRKLDPRTGSSHKDRVRLLNRFRNYAEGGGGGKGDVSLVLQPGLRVRILLQCIGAAHVVFACRYRCAAVFGLHFHVLN